jgi:hypothetical protein
VSHANRLHHPDQRPLAGQPLARKNSIRLKIPQSASAPGEVHRSLVAGCRAPRRMLAVGHTVQLGHVDLSLSYSARPPSTPVGLAQPFWNNRTFIAKPLSTPSDVQILFG